MKKNNGLRHKKARKSIKKDGREKTETKSKLMFHTNKGRLLRIKKEKLSIVFVTAVRYPGTSLLLAGKNVQMNKKSTSSLPHISHCAANAIFLLQSESEPVRRCCI
jgi:hypothetical protein